MLTNQLRELERDGLITRKIYAQVPPKVEYSITAFGKTLKPVLLALKNWAEKNMLPRMAEKDIPPETTKVAARKTKGIAPQR